jgi:hypothetical protein
MSKRPTLASVQAKLARARAALKAIRTISTAVNPRIRLEYATAIAETALEMTK